MMRFYQLNSNHFSHILLSGNDGRSPNANPHQREKLFLRFLKCVPLLIGLKFSVGYSV